jgi:hypothetical protein
MLCQGGDELPQEVSRIVILVDRERALSAT